MKHEFYMRKALELAEKAFLEDEVPVGVVIVDSQTGEIISQAHNESEHNGCCTSHAEILAINLACQKLGVSRLRKMDMYVTLEPCTMCAGAISFARIENLYIGAKDEKGGAVLNGVEFYKASTCHHKPKVCCGILEEECSQILKKFFKEKRKAKKD